MLLIIPLYNLISRSYARFPNCPQNILTAVLFICVLLYVSLNLNYFTIHLLKSHFLELSACFLIEQCNCFSIPSISFQVEVKYVWQKILNGWCWILHISSYYKAYESSSPNICKAKIDTSVKMTIA